MVKKIFGFLDWVQSFLKSKKMIHYQMNKGIEQSYLKNSVVFINNKDHANINNVNQQIKYNKDKPIVISFVSLKGGDGKSALSLLFAHYLNIENKKVIFLDAGDGHTASRRFECEKFQFKCIARSSEDELKNISSFKSDYVIIDTSRNEKNLKSAIRESDVVIIPVRPGASMFTFPKTIQYVKDVQFYNKKLNALILKNFYHETYSEEYFRAKIVENNMEQNNIFLLKTAIPDHDLFYTKSMLASIDCKMKRNIKKFINECLHIHKEYSF